MTLLGRIYHGIHFHWRERNKRRERAKEGSRVEAAMLLVAYLYFVKIRARMMSAGEYLEEGNLDLLSVSRADML